MSNASIYASLTAQTQALVDRVYSLFGAKNVTLTSGDRSASHNATIPGASSGSQHIGGNAFDFKVAGYDPATVQAMIAGAIPSTGYGQNIQEYGLGMNPRNHLSAVGTRANGTPIVGETLIGRDGRYTPIKVSPISADPKTWGDQIAATLGPWAGSISNFMGTGLAAPGDAIDSAVNSVVPDLNSWFMRISVGVLAIVFIAAALFALKSGDVIQSVKGAVT